MLTAKEGGRHTPFGVGYKRQFFFGATDVTGEIASIEDRHVDPGARAHVAFTLVHPVALEPGVRFALREGGRTIGAGIVTAIR